MNHASRITHHASRLLSLILVATILLGLAGPSLAQEDAAMRLLTRMSPAARVGQLFIVTFPGTSTDEASAIYDLIVNERIGGVFLRAQNGNIDNQQDTPAQVAALTNRLQRLAWEAAQQPLPDIEGESTTLTPFVPLFVAVEQAGGGLPHTAIVNGTTPLPSPMALGATWSTTHAETAGTIVGQELSAMGVNMLLGPSLDLLTTPRPGNTADLGVRSLGGDPYWAGQIGAAYIRGVHIGSGGRVAVIPGRFPGLGSADRPLSEEVSTVQKVLEQLKQLELAPFFAVTGAADPLARPDGLRVSHIRFRGFQGNIRSTTRPVSFDPQALQQLMSLPELAPWREEGGLTVADELGVRAVRRFYDPTELEFKNRSIALDAFLAGNDLLILSQFALTEDWESQIDNVRDTLDFFRSRYATDSTFQSWVDQAVLRILRAKLRLHGGVTSTFTIRQIEVDPAATSGLVGRSSEAVVSIARDAVTLLSPPTPDLRPAPPAADERIVIFTDDRLLSPCAGCNPVYAISPTRLEETMLQLYGPRATNQVRPAQVSSFSFGELLEYLTTPPAAPVEGTPPVPSPVGVALAQSDWVIFAMLDISDRTPNSYAVRRFLAEQVDLYRNKKIVVFAFAAPYYLDTTEIAKLTAYYGLYSHTAPFVEMAVRALFDEFPFAGAPPVSVPGINYDLIVQTQPNPAQMIQIQYEVVGSEAPPTPQPEGTATPQPTPPTIEIHQGDTLRLRTTRIIDRNGRTVPDGTPAEFIFTYPQEGLEHTVQVTTRDGVAETTRVLDRVGQLQISIRADPVPRAVRLEMDIREGEAAIIVPITPEPSPSPEPSPTPTEVPTPAGAIVEPTDPNGELDAPKEMGGAWAGLALGLIVSLVVAASGYVLHWRANHNAASALRIGLCCLAGGLVAYIGVVTALTWAHEQVGLWTITGGALVGAAFPLLTLLVGRLPTLPRTRAKQ